jgi:hypothetical protein
VVNGAGEFYDRATGERFVPRGNNYTRLANLKPPCLETGFPYHAVFNVGEYDAARIENTLAAMQLEGYNLVRVFLNGVCLGKQGGGLNEDYLRNVGDFLRLAKTHSLFVLFTTDDPPVPGYSGAMNHYDDIDWENRQFLTVDGVQANGRFWEDFILELARLGAPLDYVFAYELRNEQFFHGDHRPLNMTSGLVKTGNRETYDMADPAAKEAMMAENLVYWIDGVRAAILEVDPTALVTVGFFWPQGPNPARIGDTRWVTTEPAIRESSADFIDLHAYPAGELTLEQYVENFGIEGMEGKLEKPILMGEFGLEKSKAFSAGDAARVLHDWQVESCQYGFGGWLLWTWDTAEQTDFYNGLSGSGEINSVLAPANRPDPCLLDAALPRNAALNAAVAASRSLPDQLPVQAVDGLADTVWGAGDFPPQWIRIELEAPGNIVEIRLQISQYPSGATTHRVWGSGPDGREQMLHEFNSGTQNLQWLSFDPPQPWLGIQFVRVETIASPSWVGWREIQIFVKGDSDGADS